MSDEALVPTRHSLHAVAEIVLAGAQYAASGRIALRVRPGGFATRFDPDLSIEDGDLVGSFGRIGVDGRTPRELCTAAGTVVTDLAGLYADGATYGPDDRLRVDPDAAVELAAAWAVGREALLLAVPGADPILWPEHFDVGISIAEVNLGVSPGDAFLPVPYAYVGPWAVPREDPFFDAPFGAARTLRALGGVDGVTAFLVEGLARAR